MTSFLKMYVYNKKRVVPASPDEVRCDLIADVLGAFSLTQEEDLATHITRLPVQKTKKEVVHWKFSASFCAIEISTKERQKVSINEE